MYRIVTPPTDDLNLISLDEAREFLYIDPDDYPDADLTKMIGAARSYVEQLLQRAVLESQWIYFRDSFFLEFFNESQTFVQRDRTNAIEIPRPDLITVEALTYFDADNTEQALIEDSDFVVILVGEFLKSMIEPIQGSTWPTTFYRKNAFKLEYTAGWAVGVVPTEVRQAILITLGDMYENRQTNVTGVSVSTVNTMNSLLSAWKVDNF